MNSLKLFKLTQEEDKPFVEEIINNVNTLIETNIISNIMEFSFDFLPIVSELTAVQINRINDEVIKYFRSNGIRITLSGEYLYDKLISEHEELDLEHYISEYSLYFPIWKDVYYHPIYYYRNYNFVTRPNHIVNIKLFTRLSREYMKSYV